jgi:membrane-bound metal-dependent hydrolase YbcI (DUF457 family)
VDVVSHLCFGRALVAIAHRATPSTTAPAFRRALTGAIVIGSIAPDIDAVLMPTGWDRYLIWHERGTHTVFGILIVAALLASLIRFVIQPLLRRPPELRPPWPRLWVAAVAGCASHLLLDVLCGGSLQLLWPLSTARITSGLVAMADPLLAVPLVLFVLIAAIWRRRAFELAIAVLIVMALVLGVKSYSRAVALRTYTRAIEAELIERPIRLPWRPVTIEARWASVSGWYFYDRTSTDARAFLVDAKTGDVTPYVQHQLDVPLGSPAATLVEASRKLDTVNHALELFEFVFPDVIPREDGTIDVLWSDIRFCRPIPTVGSKGCDLRFGGRFDLSGHALEQVVLIGTVRQSRSVPAGH